MSNRIDAPTPPLDIENMPPEALLAELLHRKIVIDAAIEAQGRLLLALEGMVRAHGMFAGTSREQAALAAARAVIAEYADPAPELHPTGRDLAAMEGQPR